MPSIAPVISAIRRVARPMSSIVATTRCTAASFVAAADASATSALACAACSALCCTAAVICSMLAAVCSTLLACAIRAAMSLLPAAMSTVPRAMSAELLRTCATIRARPSPIPSTACTSRPISSSPARAWRASRMRTLRSPAA